MSIWQVEIISHAGALLTADTRQDGVVGKHKTILRGAVRPRLRQSILIRSQIAARYDGDLEHHPPDRTKAAQMLCVLAREFK